MPITEYHWLAPEAAPPEDGWEPVRAEEMPELATPDDEVIRNGDVGLYKRKVTE